ncbi:MAG: hypothetical protein NTU79_00610 [Planctomycetota bacterium]|nr:hypothetical protein [Planctomycetota bacterium]
MSTGTTNVRRERSWTQQQERAPNRRVAMVFLGFAAVCLFFFFVWYYFNTSRPPRAFASPLSVIGYKDGVAEIRVGKWELEKRPPIYDIISWKLQNNDNEVVQKNEEEITLFLAALEKQELDKQKDTVIIPLRCHAAVTKDDDVKQGSDNWSGELYINEDSTPFRFAKFLELTAKVPAKNIVIFAEVADLQFEPHLGWVVNPIEEYIRRACEDLRIEPGRKVWIVLSNADFESPYFSVKRKKTLFQEASELALREDSSNASDGQTLNLAHYFKMIYQHCHAASDGGQTPKLILANNARVVIDPFDENKFAANEVFMGKYRKSTSKKSDKTPEKSKEESAGGIPPAKEVQIQSGQRAVFISFQQADEKAAPDPKLAKIETDMRLRFWQIRDEIEANADHLKDPGNNKQLWSPKVFAPFAWRKLLADVARESIWSASNPSLDSDRVRAMEKLRDRMAENGTAQLNNDDKGDHWMVVAAWNDFLSPDAKLRTKWQSDSTGEVDSSTGLLGPEIDIWRKQRLEYRSYIDCLAELSAWIELTAELARTEVPKEQIREMSSVCNDLVAELQVQKKYLPRDDTESAAKKSEGLKLAKALGLRKRLYEHVNRVIDSSRLRNEKENLSWLRERTYQVLLSSSLLKYEQRAQLVKAIEKSDFKVEFAKTDPKSIQTKSAADGLEMRCEMLKNFWPLLSDNSAQEALKTVPKNGDFKGFMEWGEDYSLKIGRVASSNGRDSRSVTAWHFLILVDPRFAFDTRVASTFQQEMPNNKSWAGIVVSPIDPKTIRLSMALQAPPTLDFPEGTNEKPLLIHVQHFDGSPVSDCELKWTSNLENKGFSVTYETKPIGFGKTFTAKPNARVVELKCSLQTAFSPENGTKMLLNAKSTVGDSNELAIEVMRNASRIDLIVQREGDSQPLAEKLDKKESWIELRSPAIKGATSEFRLSMSNKKNEVRSAGLRLKVYSNLSPMLDTTVPTAIYEFENQLLQPKEKRPVSLKLVDTNQKSPKEVPSPLQNLDASNSMLIFEIVEYEVPKKDASVEKKENEKKKEKGAWRYPARFVPVKPSDPPSPFVKSTPQPIEDKSNYSIDFEAIPALWSLGLEKVDVLVSEQFVEQFVINAEKKTFPLIDLTGGQPKKPFIGSVVNNSPKRFLIDIGGYPRALAYEATENSRRMVSVNDDQIKLREFRPILTQPNPNVQVEKFGPAQEYTVFPTLINGVNVEYRGIEIDTEIDRATNSNISYEILKEGDNEKIFEQKTILKNSSFPGDRSFVANIGMDERFTLNFVPGELKIRHANVGGLNGAYIFRVNVGKKRAETKFIFDKTKPRESYINAEGAMKKRINDNSIMSIRLEGGEPVDIGIETTDASGEEATGSGVTKAVFGSCQDVDPPLEYLESHKPIEGVPTPVFGGGDGRVSVKLDPKAFATFTKGTYWITAKTIDRAGNIQTRNRPLQVEWMGSKKATSK